VYTNGYLFKEKPGERKLNINAVKEAEIDVAYYRKLKQGADVENNNGVIIKNETVTSPPPNPKSYAFCSDTLYDEAKIPIIEGVDVLYHESTFLERHLELAEPTKHSTAIQAAKIAKKAKVAKLILGHYSTRYDNISEFKTEAETVFPNVDIADDGKVFEF